MATSIPISEVGQKPAAVSLTSSEEAITVTSATHPRPWAFMVWSDTAWFYNSVGGQADPGPIGAGQPLTFAMRNGRDFLFYAKTATTAKLHLLVLN